jgi:hypothetical protein
MYWIVWENDVSMYPYPPDTDTRTRIRAALIGAIASILA